MIEESKYKMFRGVEGVFGGKTLGIKILIASDTMPNTKDYDDPFGNALYKAGTEAIDAIEAAILSHAIFLDPKAQEAARKEREEIVGLFPDPVFVEEIPNGYCSRYCCKHLPWFIVTTSLGRIKIGWRKRVIEIDWSESTSNISGVTDFVKQDVTKGDKYIHAWSLKDAERYIEIILGLQAPEREEEEGAL